MQIKVRESHLWYCWRHKCCCFCVVINIVWSSKVVYSYFPPLHFSQHTTSRTRGKHYWVRRSQRGIYMSRSLCRVTNIHMSRSMRWGCVISWCWNCNWNRMLIRIVIVNVRLRYRNHNAPIISHLVVHILQVQQVVVCAETGRFCAVPLDLDGVNK